MKRIFSGILPSAGVLAMLMATPAVAQDAPAAATSTDDSSTDEIVVTGTFIRGIAPTGANVLGVDRKDVEASGATSTNELLTTIPQVANLFNQADTTATSASSIIGGVAANINFQSQITRPTLRNLTPNTSSGSSTLVLVDGHRIVNAGVTQAAPDADIVPPGAIERVEVVTDGGSSLYGADAVGGVINFITRRSYEGVGVTSHYGFGDNYETYDASVIAGTKWDGGGAFASYTHQHKTDILGRDRDYVRGLDWSVHPTRPFTLSCAEPNVTVAGSTYAVNADGTALGAAGTSNRCDNTDFNTVVPEETHDTFLVGGSQKLTSFANFNVRAYTSERDTNSNGGPLRGTNGDSVTITASNPNFIARFPGDTASQKVNFNFAPVNGNSATTEQTNLKSWGVTADLAIDLGADWQLSLMSNYGRSETFFRNRHVNTAALNAAAAATDPLLALNPYEITDTPADVLNGILNTGNLYTYGRGVQRMVNHRAVFDGPIFTLPGGAIRAAVGAEYLDEAYNGRQGEIPAGGELTLSPSRYERHVNAVFAELNIPIIGETNRLPFVESLSLSLSERRDDYSDFGETTNPRIAITYEPTTWLHLRGNWGEAFNAPTVVDQGNAQIKPNAATFGAFFPIDAANGHNAPTPGQTMLFFAPLGGSVPSLQPQEATTWSYGFDVEPPMLQGLHASVTYYNIEYRGILGQPPFFDGAQMVSLYPQFITYSPDAAFLTDLQTKVANPDVLTPLIADPTQIYAVVDARRRNLGSSRNQGIDFSADLTKPTDFGSIELGFSGNYRLQYSTTPSPLAPFVEQDLDVGGDPGPRFHYRANIAGTFGKFYTRATYNHTGGYHTRPQPGTLFQTDVLPYSTLDLYLRYNLGEIAGAKQAALTLNLNNVLDQDPPTYRFNGGSGFTNGSTLGRVLMLGVDAHF